MESFDALPHSDRLSDDYDEPVKRSIVDQTKKAIASITSGNADVDTRSQASSQLEEAKQITRTTEDAATINCPPEVPVYPQLTHKAFEAPRIANMDTNVDDEEIDEDGIGLSKPSQRNATPPPELLQHNHGAFVHNVGEEGVMRMHRFTLYETQSLYYIIGSDILRTSYRILKISRLSDQGELDVTEDDIVYTQKETQQIVNAVDEGNRATGGLKVKTNEFWGLLGFVKFTGAYYMVIVTKRTHVAVLGGHYIDRIDKTEMIQLTTTATARVKAEKYLEEARLVSIFGMVDLSKGFYFSPSYDITRTLQHNILRERKILNDNSAQPQPPEHNDMFIWNHHLLEPAKAALQNPFDWCLAVTHGYIDQCALSIYWGRVVYITIIARRSRFFAGARYLKRGANDLGFVANDVETEQIVSEMRTQSFHAPGPELFASPLYTSYVQHRGSIPLYWSQDATGVSPKPDIHLNVVDPFFSAAALHFDNLFERYGTPIYALNLIKQKERSPREGKLGTEYQAAVGYLNQFLPEDKKIIYHAFDMSRVTKSKGGDVIGDLEEIAEDVVTKTGFFHNGYDLESGLRLQKGVARTNCIDCLDRTNAAQFIVGKKALGQQLRALGVIEDDFVQFDSDAVTIFTNMWHDHGDTIAIQYGGSHLVNTMSTYRKINQWTSHSRDMVESLKRFYNNSFLDAQRQESYNLFLGTYRYRNGYPLLWDLSTDYYLHHTEPRSMFGRRRPSYRAWYTPAYLEEPQVASLLLPKQPSDRPLSYYDDYWSEYYRPLTLSSYRKIFAFKIHSNLTIINVNEETQGGKYDLSPFKVRTGKSEKTDPKEKAVPARKKGVKVIAPSDEGSTIDGSSIDARLAANNAVEKPNPQELGEWLDRQQQAHALRRKYTGIIKDSSWEKASRTPTVPAMPPAGILLGEMPQQQSKQDQQSAAFERMVTNSLNPRVVEMEEYEQYMSHPASIQLVTSTETDYAKAPKEFIEYIARNQDPTEIMYAHALSSHVDGYSEVDLTLDERAELSIDDYQEYVSSGMREDALTVLDEDAASKRYKKYRSWVTRGKSLFKQKYYLGGELV
ncbi:phosphatidylinositol-3,5-bisphosphate 5-phosphatase [Lithohypha guttulata]|uniref:Phosphatidylinositol-3,5-bisphosphate 5-phosphatase n=1 Tax=Lithohypha guttulata TaxID=1690604 RepID=A0AAN7T0Z3_9EURO|nr:phosphatidylinositol-3,5-bisphosphate 5-phosphatase [Lithohypha guttulata]KAK5098338.1 phosphatidylinositol-3,5-bisphosphate 5-phosphatase [Lithohypha guttulata]